MQKSQDGLRQISEIYYAKAEDVAQDLAKEYFGKSFDVKSA